MFRLLNFALALAALANVILTPTRWLSGLIVSDEAARSFYPFVHFLVETGINLLLPVAVLLVCFSAVGLHKKAHASMPPPPFALSTTWMLYFILWLLPHTLSSNAMLGLGYIFAFYGGWLFLLIAGISYGFVVIVSIGVELSNFKQADVAPQGLGVPFQQIGVAIFTLFLVTFSILWFSPGKPIYAAAVDKSAFKELCEGVGVRLLLLRPDEVLSSILDAPVLEVAHDTLWVLFQHHHVSGCCAA